MVLLSTAKAYRTNVAFTQPQMLLVLAATAFVAHAMDVLSGVLMMTNFGLATEQNPIARVLFSAGGPAGVIYFKVIIVVAGLRLLLWLGEQGRGRLARNAIVLVFCSGLLGLVSNAV